MLILILQTLMLLNLSNIKPSFLGNTVTQPAPSAVKKILKKTQQLLCHNF